MYNDYLLKLDMFALYVMNNYATHGVGHSVVIFTK